MQTFLPYPDFKRSAQCLDNKRLGKQRVEAGQILDVIMHPGRKGWQNHPAVNMWRNNTGSLLLYRHECIVEWITRGFRNNMPMYDIYNYKVQYPDWFGNEDFHASHRSNLLRKDPTWYGQFGWKEPNDLPYVWPTKTNQESTMK